jgi:hypothetical protein
MAVDRYANDGVNSARTVRLRYDVPPPADGEFVDGGIAAVRLPRGGDGRANGSNGHAGEVRSARTAARAAARNRARTTR